MPIHDAYARITPFEILLPREDFPGDRFPLIRTEAEERGGSVDTPEFFLLLAETALALREIRGEEDPPELVKQHGALLFQAFHFWEAERPVHFLETDVVRFLVQNGPGEGEWNPALPGRAGYVQFPQHLIWAASQEGEVPESLDGIFWAAPDGENVTFLVVMGMRKDRPGLAVVPLPTLPLDAAAPWASMDVRSEGDDFAASLPGAELEGLYAVTAGGEVVKLAMRVFWYLDQHREGVVEGRGPQEPPGSEAEGEAPEGAFGEPSGAGGASPLDPRPTSLPHRRVTLGAS